MAYTGRCYCGEVRYEAGGSPAFQGQCHCRECQYISGGMPVTREFCPSCGTHLTTRSPNMPGLVMLKVGTLDDPSVFKPQMVIFTCDKQPFHQVPTGIPAFERTPG